MTSSDREIPVGLLVSDALDEGEVRDTLPTPEPASGDARAMAEPADVAGAHADDGAERDAPDTLPTPPPTPDMAVEPVIIPPVGAPPRFEA
jgi:hypothetical protein